MFVIFICYETNDISYRLLKKKKSFVPPNTEKKKTTNATQIPPCFIYYKYNGKYREAGVQLENYVVSGIAYSIAQTAVVCVISPDIISITACP